MSSNKSSNQKTLIKNQRQQTPLKVAIQARLSSNKRYASTHANISNFQLKQVLSQIQFDLIERQTSKNSELINKIYQNQSKKYPGFFQYQDWLKHNQKFFSHVNKQTIENFFKILRIINYGEVLLPTGLVYQLTQALQNNVRYQNIQQALNRFLEFNNKQDRVKNFRQLKNYKSLKQIIQLYKKPVNHFIIQRKKLSNTVKENYENVFQRNFKEYKSRQSQTYRTHCQNIANQVKACSFRPQIKNKYYNQRKEKEFVKPQRVCQNKQKWQYKDKDQQPFQQVMFKAREYDSINFQYNLFGIPGVQDHLCRKNYSQAQKQRIKRRLIRPVALKSSKYSKSTLDGLYL